MAVAKVAKARTHHALCFTKSATRPSALDNQSDDEWVICITRSGYRPEDIPYDVVIVPCLRTKLVSSVSYSAKEGEYPLVRKE